MRGPLSSPLSIALVAVSLALSDPRAVAEEKKVEVKIKIGECEEALSTNMPGGMSALVEREGEATTPECAAAALGQTREAITESKMFTAMGKGAATSPSICSERFPAWALSPGVTSAKALEALLESGGTLDGFKEKLRENARETGLSELAGHEGWELGDETSEFLTKELAEKIFKVLQSEHVTDSHEMEFHLGFCEGSIVITLDYSIEQGTGEVRIAVTGDCHCTPFRGGVRIGRFSVIGVAPVSFSKPVKGFGGWEIPCKLGQPRYYVWAPCCQQSEGHWTTPGDAPPPPNPEEPQTTEPPPGKNKENTDYRAVMVRCDPTGRLKDLIRWNERRLQDLYDQKADAKRIAFRKGELARVQRELCDCLRKMKGERSLAGDAGMQKLLDDLIRSFCRPPEPGQSRPAGSSGRLLSRRLPGRERRLRAGPYEVSRRGREQSRARANNGQRQEGLLRVSQEEIRQQAPARSRSLVQSETAEDALPASRPSHGEAVSRRLLKTSSLIGLVLPTDCHPGDTLTGTVVLNPKDYEGIPALRVVELQVPLEYGADGKPTLHGVTVDLGSGHGQPADGPITCTIPKDGSKISVTVGRTDTPQPIAKTDVPVKAQPPAASAPRYVTPPVCVNNGGPQVIRGPFSGNGSTTNIEVGGRPALVIAETPREVYYNLPEGTAAGDNTVVVHERGKEVSFHVCVVNLGMSADRLTLLRGESTNFTATVSGLDGLPSSAWLGGTPSDLVDLEWIRRVAPGLKMPRAGQPGVLLLTIENRSPDTITLEKAKGEVIVLTIDRGSLKNGAYEFRGTIHSKKSGGFSIHGTVVPFLAPAEGTPSR